MKITRYFFYHAWLSIKAIGVFFIFAAVLLFGTIIYSLGFTSCWQCKKIIHRTNTRRYWTLFDTKRPARVCPDCLALLNESDRRWNQ